MAGAGDASCYVSSWGWYETDGVRWRRWSVSRHHERVGFLLLPAEATAIEALLIASRAWED